MIQLQNPCTMAAEKLSPIIDMEAWTKKKKKDSTK